MIDMCCRDTVDNQPILFVETDRKRLAALGALLIPHVPVDAPVSAAQTIDYARHRTYRLALVNVCATGVATGLVMRLLSGRAPRTPIVAIASPRDLAALSAVGEGALDAVFGEPPPVPEIMAVLGRYVPALRRRRWSRQVIAAVDDVCRHGVVTMSVQGLADRIGASRNHLTALFQAQVGLGVREYLRGAATVLASRLLLESDAKLEDVASEAGFCDASHLSRVFRRHMGIRPGAFRDREAEPAAG